MRLSECYALLEVPPEATLEEIKVSYRKLAFKYHPDLNPDDAHAAQRFSRLNQAYVLLKDHRARGAEKKTYTAEDIRQEEEARAGARPGRSDAFFSRQEEVLKDILSDPFARQVFEDIFSRLKRGAPPGDMPCREFNNLTQHSLFRNKRTSALNLSVCKHSVTVPAPCIYVSVFIESHCSTLPTAHLYYILTTDRKSVV